MFISNIYMFVIYNECAYDICIYCCCDNTKHKNITIIIVIKTIQSVNERERNTIGPGGGSERS